MPLVVDQLQLWNIGFRWAGLDALASASLRQGHCRMDAQTTSNQQHQRT
jgi:hypothetical protein